MARSNDDHVQEGLPSSRALRFDMKLEEDVGAAIEDLIMYSRLGFVNHALKVINEVLWRHILFFPALAELSLFLLEQDKMRRLRSILTLLTRQALDYREIFSDDEKAFVRLLGEITSPLDSSHTKALGIFQSGARVDYSDCLSTIIPGIQRQQRYDNRSLIMMAFSHTCKSK